MRTRIVVHALERDGARGTVHHFVQCDQNVAFYVRAPQGEFLLAFRTALAATKHAFRAAVASAAAEKLLEEVAETGASSEMEFILL